jgi:hypothetical protein
MQCSFCRFLQPDKRQIPDTAQEIFFVFKVSVGSRNAHTGLTGSIGDTKFERPLVFYHSGGREY